MPVEDANFIAGLNPSDPAGSESLGEADDHLRVVKKTITNTFVGGDGDAYDKALTVGPDYLNDLPNKLNDYVTLTGDQTVGGEKTFTDGIAVDVINDLRGQSMVTYYDLGGGNTLKALGSTDSPVGLVSETTTDLRHYYNGGDTEILTVENFGTLMPQLVDLFYPVGAFHFTFTNTNPGDRWGGTWEARAGGRFIMGLGSATDGNGDPATFDTPGNPAQGVDGTYYHTLTVNELPPHSHFQNSYAYSSQSNTVKPQGNKGAANPDNPSTTETDSYGGGQKHNNTPPYYVMYVWQRTA